MIDAVRRYDGYIVQIDRRRHFRAVRRAGRARGPSAARVVRRASDAGRVDALFGARWREAGNLPIEARVGVNTGEVVVRSISTGGGHTEYTPIGHTTNLASRMQALAPTGSIAISEQTRKLVEGYFALKPLGPDQGQRRQRTGQRLRGDRTRATAHAAAAFSRTRADQVRRPRARDGGARSAQQSRRGRVAGRSSPRWRRRAPASRGCFSSSRSRTSRAGWCWRRFRSRTGRRRHILPVIDLLHNYFKITGDDDERIAPRQGDRRRARAGSCAGRHPAVSFRAARDHRGRRSAGADGRTGPQAAHARRDQANPAARVAQPAADGDLRGPALDRRGDAGAAESARRFDRHREDSAAGQLSPRVLASVEQQDLLHAAAARSAGQGERRRDALRDARRRRRTGAAQAR